MAAANERLEFRVQAEKKAKITRAATILQLPVGEFARTAAEEKADEIIRDHDATTVVPDAFFVEMMTALDSPPAPTPALVDAMQRARNIVGRV